MEEDEEVKSTGRKKILHIFFQINNHESVEFSDLTISEYVKLKWKDDYAYQFAKDKLFYQLKDDEEIERIYRSIDDVDYRLLKPNENKNNLDEKSPENNENLNPNASKSNNTQADSEIILEEEKSELSSSKSTSSESIVLDSNQNTEPSTEKRIVKAESSIWKHATKITTNNEQKIQCNHCKNIYKFSGNTSNMLKHLTNKHPIFFQKNAQMGDNPNNVTGATKRKHNDSNENAVTIKKSCTETNSVLTNGIREAFNRVSSFKSGGDKSDRVTNAIIFMICKDLLPLSFVEHEGFLVLMKILAPLYKVPSRKTITSRMESRYEILKKDFVTDLGKIDHYCVTADNWTDCSGQNYFGVTIHFLDQSYNMQARTLGCFPLYERCTADYLKTSLMGIFQDFDVDVDKITAFVTDGGAAIKKAAIEIVGKSRHIVCLAHGISHIIPKAVRGREEEKVDKSKKNEERVDNSKKNDERVDNSKKNEEKEKGSMDSPLQKMINKVKLIVGLIHRSHSGSQELRNLQQKGKELTLIQDCPTRWTSTVDMLERYLELDIHMYAAMSKCNNPIDVLSREEVRVLREVVDIMVHIRDVITEIRGEKYPTSNFIIPIINCMKSNIEMVRPETEIGKKFKDDIQNEIDQRFRDHELCALLSISTLLDPRFKKLHFKNPLAVVSAMSRINDELENNIQDSRKKLPSVSTPNQKEPQKFKGIWRLHDSLTENQPTSTTSNTNEDKSLELKQYLQLPLIPRDKNVFEFWANASTTYPSLSKIAFKHIATLATSVPSERLFSKAGLIKTDNRNRLTAS